MSAAAYMHRCLSVKTERTRQMKIYLIDFENVKSKGLTGIDSLTEYDRVIIFYSENADTINFEMHQKVLISKAEVEYFKVHVGGKNALDFQLSTLLGYLVSKNYYTHIFVISNDKSFDFLHDFWHGKYIAAPDCTVYRTKTIAQAINYAGGKKQIIVDDDDSDTDTAVFGTQEDTAEETTAAETKPSNNTAEAQTEKAKEKPVQKAEEKKPEQKYESKKPAPAKKAPAKPEKKAEPAEDAEFTISAEELNALEASFGTYAVIKPDSDPKPAEKKPVAEKTATPVRETKPAQEAAKETAPVKETVSAKETVSVKETPVADSKPAQDTAPAKENKPVQDKPRQAREFFPTLKETLKKAEASAEDINHISQLLINSDTKEEFHNLLAKDYKQDATELYKLLRPKYLRLKEMYAAEHPEYTTPDAVKIQAAPEKAEEKKQEEKPAAPVKEKQEEAKAEATAEIPEEKPAKKKTAAKKSAEKADKPVKATRGRPRKADKAEKAEKPEKPEKPSEAAGDRLSQLLDGKCSPDETELIRQLFREVPSRQQLYIRMIKQFGKKSGCVYYNAIKGEYETLSEEIK